MKHLKFPMKYLKLYRHASNIGVITYLHREGHRKVRMLQWSHALHDKLNKIKDPVGYKVTRRESTTDVFKLHNLGGEIVGYRRRRVMMDQSQQLHNRTMGSNGLGLQMTSLLLVGRKKCRS